MTIDDAVTSLIPAPFVLFLDTCVLLDVVRAPTLNTPSTITNAHHLRTALQAPTPLIRTVVGSLVPQEWRANLNGEREKAEQKIKESDGFAHLVFSLAGVFGTPPVPPTPLGSLALVDNLVALSQDLLAAAVVLDRDPSCIGRAVDRVYAGRRPSHFGHVKDSIHLEECLELSRRLRSAAWGGVVGFTSSNTKDFAESRSSPTVHADLDPEFKALGVIYFASLEKAVGQTLLRMAAP